MIKNYWVINEDTMVALGRCFANVEELSQFAGDLENMSSLVVKYEVVAEGQTNEEAMVTALKQVCLFAIMSRNYIELTHQLIGKLEMSELTPQEFEIFKQNNRTDKL